MSRRVDALQISIIIIIIKMLLISKGAYKLPWLLVVVVLTAERLVKSCGGEPYVKEESSGFVCTAETKQNWDTITVLVSFEGDDAKSSVITARKGSI